MKGVFIGCCVIALVVAGCGGPPAADVQGLTHYQCQRTRMALSVKAAGTLQSQRREVYFAPERASIVYIAREGESVSAGDIVVTLDLSEIEMALEEQRDERAQLARQREVTRFDNRLKACELERNVGVERAKLRVAEVTLEQERGAIDAAEAVRLEREISNQEKKLTRMAADILEKEPFVQKGFVSRETVDELKYQWELGALQRDIYKTERALVLKGTPEDKILDARQEVALAQSTAKRAKIKLDRFRQMRSVEIKKFQLRIDEHDKEIKRLEKLLDKMTYRAPMAGVVLRGRAWQPGEMVKLQEGNRVHPGQEVVTVANPTSLEITMELHEAVASSVTTGAAVHFRPVANPERAFAATVSSVGRVASFSEWDMFRTKWITVIAEIEAYDPLLRLGMSVLADIQTGSKETLVIPSAAFVDEGRVRLADGTLQTVTCGTSSYLLTEVLDGLTEGQQCRVSLPAMFPRGADRQIHAARTGTVTERVKATGELRPGAVSPVSIVLTPEDSVKLNTLAEEGSAVTSGAAVAVVDSISARNTLREKELAEKVAKKELRLVQQRGKLQLDKLRHAVDLARLDRELAELSRDILITTNPLILKERALQLEIVAKQVEGMQRRLEIKQEMSRRGYASDKEVNDLLERLADVETQRDVAALRLELARRGPTPRERARAELNVRRTVLAEELATQKLELTNEKLAVQQKKARQSIRQARRDRKRYATMVAAATITAPTSGVVSLTKRWTSSGWANYKAGDTVARGSAFMRIARVETFTVRGWLPEEYVEEVAPDQAVEFYLPANPEQRYRGRVQSVGPAAVSRSVRRGVTRQVFEVTVVSEERSRRFQPGMAVQLEIVTAVHRDATVVPLSCLYVDDQGTYVTYRDGRRKAVTLKGHDETVAAVEGLAIGEEVLGGITNGAH